MFPHTIGVLLQIGSQGQHAFALQLKDQLGTVHRNHLRALAQQTLAHATANALGGAGNQRDLVVESVVHG